MSLENKYIDDTPVLLCSLADDIKLDMLIATLKEEGIPVMKKSHGTAQSLSIIMGFSYQKAEVYVPSRLHDKAQEVLAVIIGSDDILGEETEDEI